MKRICLALILTIGLVAGASAQNCPAPATAGTLPEPENLTVSLDRLVRYHNSGQYDSEIRQVANSAREYLEAKTTGTDARSAKFAAVFDVDETAISNWETMSACGFCAYGIRLKLYPEAMASTIVPVLELFNFAKSKGIAIIFITGRQEHDRQPTIKNLTHAGYEGWAELMMRPEGNKDPARVLKPRIRQQLLDKGYRIIMNIGDQASDLAGCCAERVFKLPNPFYLAD